MKKLYFLFVLVTMTQALLAQDIIVTKKSERIEAKIVEVSQKEVRYKKYTYQDGPTFIVGISDLAAIIFENGEVQSFLDESTESNNSQAAVQPKIQSRLTDESKQYNSTYNYIIKEDKDLYRIGSELLTESELAYRFKRDCQLAYQQYKSGERLKTAGWTCFAIGIGFDLGATIGKLSIGPYYYADADLISFINGCYVIAGALEIACIPTLIVGYNRSKKAIETYNTSCAKKDVASLYVGLTSEGFGLSIKF